ncbi:MAG: hypothetical protein R3B13_20005 [Polyangiaceae bacterium]
MNTRRSSLLLALLATVATWSTPLRASDPPDTAALHFDKGLELYKQKRMRDAAVEFLRAYDLAPHSDALFNAGLALEGAGDNAAAATAYTWALDSGLRDEVRSDAESRLSRVARDLGRVRVLAPEGSTAEYSVMRSRTVPATFFALPGAALVTVTLQDGRLLSRRVDVPASMEVEVRFEPPAREPLSRPSEEPTPRKDARSPVPWRTVGYVGIGVGAGLGVGAFVLHQAALSAREDFLDSGNTDADARERAVSLNTWTNVALASSLVVGAAGVGLVVFAPSPKTEVAVAVRPGGVDVSGRF